MSHWALQSRTACDLGKEFVGQNMGSEWAYMQDTSQFLHIIFFYLMKICVHKIKLSIIEDLMFVLAKTQYISHSLRSADFEIDTKKFC